MESSITNNNNNNNNNRSVLIRKFFIDTDIHGLSEWQNLMDFRGIRLSNAIDTWDEKELARSSTEGLGPRSLNH